jgi:hypothetical protein
MPAYRAASQPEMAQTQIAWEKAISHGKWDFWTEVPQLLKNRRNAHSGILSVIDSIIPMSIFNQSRRGLTAVATPQSDLDCSLAALLFLPSAFFGGWPRLLISLVSPT